MVFFMQLGLQVCSTGNIKCPVLYNGSYDIRMETMPCQVTKLSWCLISRLLYS